MIISYNWLNDWVDIDLSPENLAEKMTELGTEVDEVKDLSKNIDNLSVAAVLKRTDNAFKNGSNKMLKIDTGREIVNIVTSASNVKEGDQIVWAAPGTFINGAEIKKRNFDDVESIGMAVSLKEIGLEESSEGLIVFDKYYKNGTGLKDIPLFSDSLITYEITPNRGDLLSHLGIARELAAYFEKPLKKRVPDIDLGKYRPFDLEIRSRDVESYYCASVEKIKIAESPLWLKIKLLKCGIRPLYNIIDISNYIMLDTGQPMHAFDLDKLNKKIVVRKAGNGETIETLDGQQRTLSEDTLVIADADSSVAVAGVMGGEVSKISNDTCRILFEAAVFNPVSVRRTSKRMNLPTDASFRFERGVDRLQTRHSLAAAIDMTQNICGGEIMQAAFYDEETVPKKISLNYEKVKNYIGVSIDKRFIDKTLESLGISKIEEAKNRSVFTAPSYRHDLTVDVDLIEEVARFYGYSKIEPTIPYIRPSSVKKSKKKQKIADLLAAFGFSQVINYSFLDKDSTRSFSSEKPIEISNPINIDQSVMRTSLIPGLLDNLVTNLNYGSQTVKIFEIGTLFFRTGEANYLGMLAGGDYPANWYSKKDRFDFYDIKGVIELICAPETVEVSADVPAFLHPARSASVILDQKSVGYIGELHPDILINRKIDKPVVVAEINLDYFKSSRHYSYKKIDKLLSIKKDISLIVDKAIYTQKIIDAICEIKSVKTAIPFDLYQGKNIPEDKKSVTFNVVFDNRVKDDIQNELNKLADHLEKRLGAKLRR